MHMRRILTRALAFGGVVTLTAAGFAAAMTVPAAAAAQAPMNASALYNDTTSGNRFQSTSVNGTDGGTYTVQTNLWNKAVSGGYTVNTDTTDTAWSVTNNTANSYFPDAPNTPNAVAGQDTEPSVTNPAAYTCAVNTDANDLGCNWAGHGDPWVNPNTGARDGNAVTTVLPSFVPQQPAAPDVVGIPNDFSDQIHAPASYADIFLGCHWSSCTPGTTPAIPAGAPFPLQYTGVSRLDSVWNINVPAAGEYDASYDIWLDSNTRNCPTEGTQCAALGNPMPFLPTQPKEFGSTQAEPGQNDGAEVMIWVGSHGYVPTPANTAPPAKDANTIQPAGVQQNIVNGVVVPVSIAGIRNPDGSTAMFDVWAARSRSFDNGIRWNVITFVNRNPVLSGGLTSPTLTGGAFDAKAFTDYAATLGSVCNTDPSSPIAGDSQVCLNKSWWMTSVQAGYEIWNMPNSSIAANKNDVMATTDFSVKPIAVSGGANTGNRTCNPACGPDAPIGTPLVNWNDTFNIQAQGCPNDTAATWDIQATNFATNPATQNAIYPTSGPAHLAESPTGSGNYIATAGPLNNLPSFQFHDVAKINITIHCNGQTLTTTGTVYIDPSGEVLDLNGKPVVGASVTLSHSAVQAGPFVPVTSGDTTVMSPSNTANPSITDSAGRFAWNVTSAWYEVSATKAGCTPVGGASSPPDHVLPPPANPITGIKLVLDCGGTGGLPTTVVVRPPGVGQFGYCADITVTNNTSAPVAWNTHFVIPGGQHINQSWNMVLTQVGNQATNVHADPSNPWNTILQPGQSTTSTGFCAVP